MGSSTTDDALMALPRFEAPRISGARSGQIDPQCLLPFSIS
jgi:hypothetical protein